MQISSSSTLPSALARAAAPAPAADYQAFLKLLVAQLKNQDPTKPMDSTQYLSQLASFSSVEQAIQTNTRLDTLIARSNLDDAQAILGTDVTTPDGTSGRVASVTIADGSLILTLDSGTILHSTEGLTVHRR